MLTVAAIKSAAQTTDYFARSNYYTKDTDETATGWWGRGAATLGLSGPIEKAGFEAMLEGRLPDGTEIGTTRNGEWQHKPGWDLTWSAPKSVSVMALVVGDARLIAAHDSAVRAAMAHVEANLINTRVREEGEVTLVQTDNLVAALFRHDVNRALDPQLHTHAVVMNATQTEDGQWRSIESKPLLGEIKEAGAVYRSFLAAEVRRLGYEIILNKDGTFEIAGIDPATLEAMSSRAAAIEKNLGEQGLTRESATTTQKTEATLATRPRKERVDREALRESWRAEVSGSLLELEAVRAGAEAREQTPQQAARLGDAAAIAAIDKAIIHLAEREQSFSHQKLVQAAVRFGLGAANPAAIDGAIAVKLAQGGLIPRQVIEPSRESRSDEIRPGYTTPAAIQSERALFGLLERSHDAGRQIVSARVAGAAVAAAETHATARGYEWNDGQKAAALGILQSRDRTVLLQGAAGTAKTSTVIATVAGAAAAAGYTVRALAPSASAAQTLGNALGAEGQTVHRFLNSVERGEGAPKGLIQRVAALFATPKELWIVDEMSLLGVNKTVELLAAAERQGAKVLLTGDRLQLGSVEAGRAFDQALERGVETFRLTEIVRQKTEAGVEAVYKIIDRNAGAALALIEKDGGKIVAHDDPTARIRSIAQHYVRLSAEDRKNTILIDPSREGGEAIKATVRGMLQARGELTGPEAPGVRLLDAGLSNAEKTIAASFAGGEIVRAGQAIQPADGKAADGKLAAGEYGVVRGVDAVRDRIVIETEAGRIVTLDTRSLDPKRLDVFQPQKGELQPNDRVRWNRNDAKMQLARGDIGTVTHVHGNQVTIAFDKGGERQIDVSRKAHQHYDYAYAVTAHGAQGMTNNWVLHAESWRINLVNWRSIYVGLSRGETSGMIVTDDAGKLAQAIEARAGEKSVALDASSTAGMAAGVQRATHTALATESTITNDTTGGATADEAKHRAAAQSKLAQLRAAPTPSPSRSPGPYAGPDLSPTLE